MENRQQAATAALKFYSAWYCPFAQRAWMALLHKRLAFEYIEVDPYRESQWWLDISRNRAKVPVIVVSSEKESGLTTVIFQGTLTDPDNYCQRLIEYYLPYSQGKGQRDVTEVR